jgi:hypothetical protein
MNQTQRKFLVDKIKEKIEAQRRAFESSKRDINPPDQRTYLSAQLMTGTAKMKPEAEIIEIVRKDFAAGRHGAFMRNNQIALDIEQMFVLPEKYYDDLREYLEKKAKSEKEYRDFLIQEESIINRIMLASDSVLQGIINGIDNLGDMDLLDSTLRIGHADQKALPG